MFHLRYTHVFISNSAQILERKPVCKQNGAAEEGILHAIKNSNAGEHEKMDRNIVEKFPAAAVCLKKTRCEKICCDEKRKCKREKSSTAHRVSFNPMKFTRNRS